MSNSERYELSRDGRDDRNEERERNARDADRDRGDRRRGPICYNCNEIGHYANQCTRPQRYGGTARPSTSTDSRRSGSPRCGDWRREPISHLDRGVTQQISELGRSVVTMKQHFDEERMRKENWSRRKQEKEEEKRREEELRIREAEEKARQDEKARKKKERRRREAESHAELKKELGMQMVLQIGELEDKFVQRMQLAMSELGKGRKTTSITTGIDTPDVKGSLTRYKFRNLMMQELKMLDAGELQRICKEEGVPYDGKVDAIFDIADHRTYLNFDVSQMQERLPETINVEESENVGPEPHDDVDKETH
ncbi:hypothetical protein CBR_g50109 [Chara braunii]|uniref:CCHC-type domain-containing protein n=1 Tax=Chara braunii TaxID=69332 RepID=A0A388M652_CHABU|nr:hypothetical protein CBR_g50109 [Chara braunii]|eukprot:GBG90016.1 hypothetical protein CBR_g50109 [Chara braunii]